MKPSSESSNSSALALSQTKLQNKFNLLGQEIIPVETSSYQTINFQDPANKNSIIYSGSLSACAVVLIKNFNKKTGKYDDIVTMGHFFPANAFNHSKAMENLVKIMQDFENQGGTFSSKTSVIIAGGGLLKGEKIEDTTPLGQLLVVAKALQEQIGFKLTHHDKSINDMLGLYDKDHPETQGSAVFVNREGTAIIGYLRKKLSGETSIKLLTKEIESMPLEKLSKIRASEDFLYPEDIKKCLNDRVSQISALMEKKEKPSLTISNSEDIIRKFQEKPTSANKEQLR
jgi:hypothetical protein